MFQFQTKFIPEITSSSSTRDVLDAYLASEIALDKDVKLSANNDK